MKHFIVNILFLLTSITGFSQTIKKEFFIEKKYLNFPVDMQQGRQKVHFLMDKDTLTYSVIRIADKDADYWVFKDVSAYKGKKLTLTFAEKVGGLEQIYQSDRFAGEDSLYKETNRPQFHFSTRRGWINDPNGLVYLDGELNDALYPDELGTMFSGSAVIDKNNSAGWGKDALVAFYTAAGKKMTQNVAFSFDKGQTFTKYEGNPILGPNRDPKVFWYEPSKTWVMVLYDDNFTAIYNSRDLKKWEYKSKVKGFYECPEFFELAVDGNTNTI